MAWRFVLDGDDITSEAFSKQATRRLNMPASAAFRIPSDLTAVEPGSSRLKVYDDANALWFHGIVWTVEDEGDTDQAWTSVTAVDPMAIWPMRPARDADGDFSYPSFFTTQSTAPQIMKYIIDASQDTDHEGSMFISTAGTVDTGGEDMSATPTDWPMTIADVFQRLTETGLLDVVLTPLDSSPTIATFNAYNGDYGSDLSGSVSFQWGTGSNNVRHVRRSQDMSMMCNKLWYYGPNLSTIDSQATDAQHFRWNITGDNPLLENPPGGDVDYSNPLGDLINASRSDYWTSMDIRIFGDATSGDETTTSPAPELFLRLWQGEVQHRVGPRTMVTITPVRGTEPSFDIGDLISVQAGTRLRGGFSGTQRVYQFTVAIDDDGVVDLGEIVASADQEG